MRVSHCHRAWRELTFETSDEQLLADRPKEAGEVAIRLADQECGDFNVLFLIGAFPREIAQRGDHIRVPGRPSKFERMAQQSSEQNDDMHARNVRLSWSPLFANF